MFTDIGTDEIKIKDAKKWLDTKIITPWIKTHRDKNMNIDYVNLLKKVLQIEKINGDLNDFFYEKKLFKLDFENDNDDLYILNYNLKFIIYENQEGDREYILTYLSNIINQKGGKSRKRKSRKSRCKSLYRRCKSKSLKT
jgi:hypothetical protein